MGSALPTFLPPDLSLPLSERMIQWSPIRSGEEWGGFRLLVDDVVRYSGTALNFSLSAYRDDVPHYFRLAVSLSHHFATHAQNYL
jgi:hypothetical protein